MIRLDLSALEMFQQVAREGSVSRAADKLNRVQSNISTRVKQIEEQIGVPLFERGRRGMALTDEGRILLGYADRLLELSERAVEAVGNGKPKGTFRIGTMESTAASRLPHVLSRYHIQNPDVDVHVRTDTAGALIEQLLANQIDVAFIAEPVEFDGFCTLAVFEESLMLVMPKSFAICEDVGDMSGRSVVAFEEGCAYRRYLNQWLLEAGIVPGKIVSMGSYLGILACVSAGTGFAVVPQSVLDILPGNGNYICRPLGGRYSKIKTMMVWRKNYEAAKLAALVDILRASHQQA